MIDLLFCVTIYVNIATYYTSVFERQLIIVCYTSIIYKTVSLLISRPESVTWDLTEIDGSEVFDSWDGWMPRWTRRRAITIPPAALSPYTCRRERPRQKTGPSAVIYTLFSAFSNLGSPSWASETGLWNRTLYFRFALVTEKKLSEVRPDVLLVWNAELSFARLVVFVMVILWQLHYLSESGCNL